MARRNPTRELDISPAEMKRLQTAIDREYGGKGADVRNAASLYTRFTGHTDVNVAKVLIPNMPKAAVEVGTIDGILYTTERDGVIEKYIHRFKKSAKPTFAVSPDGKQIFVIGGFFKFGDRGIVDDK